MDIFASKNFLVNHVKLTNDKDGFLKHQWGVNLWNNVGQRPPHERNCKRDGEEVSPITSTTRCNQCGKGSLMWSSTRGTSFVICTFCTKCGTFLFLDKSLHHKSDNCVQAQYSTCRYFSRKGEVDFMVTSSSTFLPLNIINQHTRQVGYFLESWLTLTGVIVCKQPKIRGPLTWGRPFCEGGRIAGIFSAASCSI